MIPFAKGSADMNATGHGNASITRRAVLGTGLGAAAAAAIRPIGVRAQGAPKRGGTLRMSNGGDPPDFDLHQSATYLTLFVGSPCYSTSCRRWSASFRRSRIRRKKSSTT